MSRTKLSSLAHIKDLANEITKAVEGTQELYDKLTRDSERLKEIEPALKKIREFSVAPTIPEVVYPTVPPTVVGTAIGIEVTAPEPVKRSRKKRESKYETPGQLPEPDSHS
jgi:hypothetical protein